MSPGFENWRYSESGKNVEIKIGNTLELKDIPPGTSIHNVELIPGNGANLLDQLDHL